MWSHNREPVTKSCHLYQMPFLIRINHFDSIDLNLPWELSLPKPLKNPRNQLQTKKTDKEKESKDV